MPYQQYRADVIANVVNNLNDIYFLPAIQRPFIWHQEQVISLFDSVMRGYPLSSFLFWDLRPESYKIWDIYKFADNFIEGITRNELAIIDGAKQSILVLDGQQRLTSLLIGLKGSYAVKKKYMRHNLSNKLAKQRLYLDLLKAPKNPQVDAEEGIHYGFDFCADTPSNTKEHYWYRVSQILDYPTSDSFKDHKYDEKEKLSGAVTKDQMKIFEINLDTLHSAIWDNAMISYYLETEQDPDRILDIFVRANSGGTPLSKSDLLLSMATSKWKKHDAREEIYNFVDELNNELLRKNKFNKDFILKTCLVLSGLDIPYKVSNFNRENLEKIEENWVHIKAAIERGVELVNNFGIDRDTLTSANALAPILYYFYIHPEKTLLERTPFDVRNARLIRTWLSSALLNDAFGGASDQVLTETRNVLKANRNIEDFPVDALNAAISKMHRNTTFDETTIYNFLERTYGKQQTFLALSLLYDVNNWGIVNFQQDHIFPKSHFPKDQMNKANRIANLELLTYDQHARKGDQMPDKWFAQCDENFKRDHLIPLDESLYQLDKFDKFIEAREILIREHLRNLFTRIRAD